MTEATTVTISLSTDTSAIGEVVFPWPCIFCISGTNSALNLAIAEFNAATGR